MQDDAWLICSYRAGQDSELGDLAVVASSYLERTSHKWRRK